jgi:hypothetical protein
MQQVLLLLLLLVLLLLLLLLYIYIYTYTYKSVSILAQVHQGGPKSFLSVPLSLLLVNFQMMNSRLPKRCVQEASLQTSGSASDAKKQKGDDGPYEQDPPPDRKILHQPALRSKSAEFFLNTYTEFFLSLALRGRELKGALYATWDEEQSPPPASATVLPVKRFAEVMQGQGVDFTCRAVHPDLYRLREVVDSLTDAKRQKDLSKNEGAVGHIEKKVAAEFSGNYSCFRLMTTVRKMGEEGSVKRVIELDTGLYDKRSRVVLQEVINMIYDKATFFRSQTGLPPCLQLLAECKELIKEEPFDEPNCAALDLRRW